MTSFKIAVVCRFEFSEIGIVAFYHDYCRIVQKSHRVRHIVN